MKKILLGIIIGFVVIVGGCVALVGAGMSCSKRSRKRNS